MAFLKLHFLLFLAALSCSLGVVFAVNPVHSALFLILVFVFVALVLISFSTFLAVIIIIVYVGAIAVLFLFVIMMLSIRVSSITESVLRYAPLVAIILLAFVNEVLFYVHLVNHMGRLCALSSLLGGDVGFVNNPVSLSQVLYFNFGGSIILASLILLTAMVTAIVLTFGAYSIFVVKRQLAYQQHSRSIFTVVVRE